tara:strand:- start:184 stop:621 length:438 start_codon:yes stop_codon:yes gene_type:complete
MPFVNEWAEPYLPLFAKLHPDLDETNLKLEMNDVLNNMRDTLGGCNPESLEAYIENTYIAAATEKIRGELGKLERKSKFPETDIAHFVCLLQKHTKELYKADQDRNYKEACFKAKRISDIGERLKDEYLALFNREQLNIRIGRNE